MAAEAVPFVAALCGQMIKERGFVAIVSLMLLIVGISLQVLVFQELAVARHRAAAPQQPASCAKIYFNRIKDLRKPLKIDLTAAASKEDGVFPEPEKDLQGGYEANSVVSSSGSEY